MPDAGLPEAPCAAHLAAPDDGEDAALGDDGLGGRARWEADLPLHTELVF